MPPQHKFSALEGKLENAAHAAWLAAAESEQIASREGIPLSTLPPRESVMIKLDQPLLADGMKALHKRLPPAPGPDIPDKVWEEACSSDYDETAILDKVADGTFPQDVYDILQDNSDHDWFAEQLMLTLGEHTCRTCTEEDERHLQSFDDDDDDDDWFEGMTLADLICALVRDMIIYSINNNAFHDFVHSPETLKDLTLGKLRSAASEVDLDTSRGKPALIVRLVEFVYDDVLLPPKTGKNRRILAERAEDSLIRALDDPCTCTRSHVKDCLRTSKALDRKKLKSACLGTIREKHGEMLSDSDIVSMVKEEEEDLWGKLVAASTKGKKRKGDVSSSDNGHNGSNGNAGNNEDLNSPE